MLLLKNTFFFIAIFLLSTSCASSYKSIKPDTLNYVERPETEEGLTFTYQAGVLAWRGNKKMVKKERLSDIKLVAVKLTNNTGQDIIFSEDVELLSDAYPLQPLPKKEVTSKLKQTPPVYLVYLLLTPLHFSTYNENTGASSDPIPIGRIIGPGLAGINMGISATANSSFRKEMNEYDLNDKVIKNGETVYGLIGIPGSNVGTLTVRLKE